MSHPLYDTVFKRTEHLKNKPLTKIEQSKFIDGIKKVNDFELFFLLIKVHSQKNSEDEFPFPYGGKQLKKGIRFNLDTCPTHLQQILFSFLNMVNAEEKIDLYS